MSEKRDSSEISEELTVIPEYQENEYSLIDRFESTFENTTSNGEKMIHNLKLYKFFFTVMAPKINEYIEIYVTHSTPNNKSRLSRHLIEYGKEWIKYDASVITMLTRREPYSSHRDARKYYDQYMSHTHPISIKIVSECIELVRSFYYIDFINSGNVEEYTQAPGPRPDIPLSPPEGYKTNVDTARLVDMFIQFAERVLTPNSIGAKITLNRDAIIASIEELRGTAPHPNELVFNNIDVVALSTLLSRHGVPIETNDITMIIHSLNMFFVYGNFIIEDGYVVNLSAEEILNKSELDSTVFLLSNVHGVLLLDRSVASLTTPITPDAINSSIREVPLGMNIFLQKQAEPMSPTKASCPLTPGDLGTLYSYTEICSLMCSTNPSGSCNCYDYISPLHYVPGLMSAVKENLEDNKIPTSLLLQSTLNDIKIHTMSQGRQKLEKSPLEYTYVPGNTRVADLLSRATHSTPRERKYIGRTQLQRLTYIDKMYYASSELGTYGIYNLMNGSLINLHKGFMDYVEATDPTCISPIMFKIKKEMIREGVTNSPRFVRKCTFNMILDYFNSLGYKNIILLDHSCESSKVIPLGRNSPLEIEISNLIGDKGLGKKKLKKSQKKSKRKSQKKSKRKLYKTYHRTSQKSQIL
jgi:hypothetical protein